MRLPIRVRLTAWYVALLAAIVAGLGAFVVLQLRSDLTAGVDRRLDATAAEIARAYEIEGLEDFHDISASVLARPGGTAELVDPGGAVVARHGEPLPEGTPYRFDRRPVERDGETLTLVTAAPLGAADRAADRLLTLLLVGGGAALLVTAAGGWWLARKALRPVDRMTAQADAIGSDDLDRRLEVPPARDEIAHLGRTLNAMLDRVERGVADKRRLIADASHELRGPLTVMRAELDVALGDPQLDPSARGVLESARDEAARMARMVDDMLTLAQIDEGRLELVTEPVDLRELAPDVEGEPVMVEGDRMRLAQALGNLIDNARKYGGGEVRVETWRRGDEAGIAVSDEGPGIPPDQRARIFERFVRLDAARGRGGSGLGLAICAEVAAAHGGRAWMEPGRDGGSRFVLALPNAERPSLRPIARNEGRSASVVHAGAPRPPEGRDERDDAPR